MINKEYYVKLNQDAQEHYQLYKQEAEARVHRRSTRQVNVMTFRRIGMRAKVKFLAISWMK